MYLRSQILIGVHKAVVPKGVDGAVPTFYTSRRRRSHALDQTIFRLLLLKFGVLFGKTANGNHRSPATLWRVTVESWLRCQGLILIRQNQNVSTTSPKIWSHN